MTDVTMLDTHVVIWLASGNVERISPTAQQRIAEAQALRISPIVRLELALLHELGRLSATPSEIIDRVSGSGIVVSDISLNNVAAVATTTSWTRDPFDRMIVAHAAALHATLLTKDRQIRTHYADAVW